MGKHILTTILAISIISLASICTVSADLNDTPVSPVELGTIDAIQDAIDAEGSNWTAGTTSVSELTVDEKRQLCGARIGDVPEDAQLMRPPLQSGVSCDLSFDWRNKDGKDWMTPVKNQGLCGSCWAFSALGIVEVAINIHFNDSDKDIDLSEQHLVSDCCNAGSCRGGWPDEALKYVKDTGVPEESCSPYASSDSACTPCTDWAENPWKVVDYEYVSSTTDSFKYALQTYGPLSVVLSAPDDWFYYSGGVYEPAWSDSCGVGWANHAVILVGWNDSEGCWIIQNSWGTGWGEQGYARVRYGDLEKYNYAYAVTGIVHDDCGNSSIRVEPAEINVTMSAGDCSLANLTIRNCGDAQLTYTITDDASWLTPASTSGTVEPGPGALTSVVVSFNATNLEANSYNGEIRIESNDLNNATVIIPVALSVTPANQPPVASASASPENGTTHLTVAFTGSGEDHDGVIISYEWAFGDGGSSTLQNPGHTYDSPDTYTATLTVTDDCGVTGSDNVTIIISPTLSTPPNITSLTPSSPVSNTEGATRTFSITIDQPANVSWLINGTVVDADTGVTEANYTNMSATLGVWNVSAAVSNANGTDTQTWIWNVVPEVPGDVTCDGKVNIGDAVLLFNWVSFPNERGTKYALSAPENADVNGNGKVNIGDAVLLFNWVSFQGERGVTYVLK
ncbi:MAG: C1 family peptidase [Euryarchaeota archaeon]|nr:C1 family peptidase [Euryarchaeota archaeon]